MLLEVHVDELVQPARYLSTLRSHPISISAWLVNNCPELILTISV